MKKKDNNNNDADKPEKLEPKPSSKQEPSKPESSTFILSQNKPWEGNANPIWMASTISLLRNVEKFKFPPKLHLDRKKQILSLVAKGLTESKTSLKNPRLLRGDEISSLEKEFLMEHFLSTENYNLAQQGEGFILDESGKFLAALNLQDHIQLSLLDCVGELESTWARLVKLETQLGKIVHYSFLPKFGFLTTDPTQCGTGLIVSLYLQLSGLIHTEQIDTVLEKYLDESLLIAGIQGSPTEIIGDIVVVQNNYTLGITEENIISTMRNFITKILVEERSARAEFQKDEKGEFKDKVSRAYAVLVHSYQIEAIEALNALSLLKLGTECGWISGINHKQINELFFNCRRAHLMRHFPNETIAQSQIPHLRAEYIHKALKGVKLTV